MDWLKDAAKYGAMAVGGVPGLLASGLFAGDVLQDVDEEGFQRLQDYDLNIPVIGGLYAGTVELADFLTPDTRMQLALDAATGKAGGMAGRALSKTKAGKWVISHWDNTAGKWVHETKNSLPSKQDIINKLRGTSAKARKAGDDDIADMTDDLVEQIELDDTFDQGITETANIQTRAAGREAIDEADLDGELARVLPEDGVLPASRPAGPYRQKEGVDYIEPGSLPEGGSSPYLPARRPTQYRQKEGVDYREPGSMPEGDSSPYLPAVWEEAAARGGGTGSALGWLTGSALGTPGRPGKGAAKQKRRVEDGIPFATPLPGQEQPAEEQQPGIAPGGYPDIFAELEQDMTQAYGFFDEAIRSNYTQVEALDSAASDALAAADERLASVEEGSNEWRILAASRNELAMGIMQQRSALIGERQQLAYDAYTYTSNFQSRINDKKFAWHQQEDEQDFRLKTAGGGGMDNSQFIENQAALRGVLGRHSDFLNENPVLQGLTRQAIGNYAGGVEDDLTGLQHNANVALSNSGQSYTDPEAAAAFFTDLYDTYANNPAIYPIG